MLGLKLNHVSKRVPRWKMHGVIAADVGIILATTCDCGPTWHMHDPSNCILPWPYHCFDGLDTGEP